MRVIFLDRDGVINKYPGDRAYVTSLRKFKFLPGAKKAISFLSKAGFKIFVASNQAGVGRGMYSQRTLDRITAYMLEEVKKAGGHIDKVYYCTHRKDAGCSCRKPRPGMLKKAAREFNLSLKNAYFVGDTDRDIHTAHNAGCKPILVTCGANKGDGSILPDLVFDNLLEAAKYLLKRA
ncbi:MAG: D-glycero-beta-D-manno-heptose 1,7-bisphosphate 7-phosphatase [Candidatus Omnitrophica bacterium]|nr:D-glycero-beta-D-manno-heptose 1,7-bisphosphate 7-phosphatase [Candidatus Omnitrophota bacterium]